MGFEHVASYRRSAPPTKPVPAEGRMCPAAHTARFWVREGKASGFIRRRRAPSHAGKRKFRGCRLARGLLGSAGPAPCTPAPAPAPEEAQVWMGAQTPGGAGEGAGDRTPTGSANTSRRELLVGGRPRAQEREGSLPGREVPGWPDLDTSGIEAGRRRGGRRPSARQPDPGLGGHGTGQTRSHVPQLGRLWGRRGLGAGGAPPCAARGPGGAAGAVPAAVTCTGDVQRERAARAPTRPRCGPSSQEGGQEPASEWPQVGSARMLRTRRGPGPGTFQSARALSPRFHSTYSCPSWSRAPGLGQASRPSGLRPRAPESNPPARPRTQATRGQLPLPSRHPSVAQPSGAGLQPGGGCARWPGQVRV